MNVPLSPPSGTSGPLGVAGAWKLLRGLARLSQLGAPAGSPTYLSVDAQGVQVSTDPADAWISLADSSSAFSWTPCRPLDPAATRMLELYLPLCAGPGAADLVVGHLGQSVDGFIATSNGDSKFVTGPANIEHIHRMRALFDAVIVGRGTVAADDPLLTTRLVEGDNPRRVVIDPQRRLDAPKRVFANADAQTVIVCADDAPTTSSEDNVIRVPMEESGLSIALLLAGLRQRGLRRVFVEGGGVTVSRMLNAAALHRLQITVAPVFVGAGIAAIRVPAAVTMGAAMRPPCRSFAMGNDAFFEFDLRAQS